MASTYPAKAGAFRLHGALADPKGAIGGPVFDALLLWGCPLASALFVWLWIGGAALLPPAAGAAAVTTLAVGVSVLTFAHLIAVAPRAYLNREVFMGNRARLTVVPVLLVAALTISPTLLVIGGVLAVFWDVHHSAMQSFGLARIYDMKAGNGALVLRRTDLRLNWALYVGPIAAGASLMDHLVSLDGLGAIGWTTIASLPSIAESRLTGIAEVAITAWLGVVGWAVWDYRGAVRQGYRLPVQKAALLASTGFVSIAAWGFATPIVAFAIINLFHAIQYFALVWLKEGARIKAASGRIGALRWGALALFLTLCAAFGFAYQYGRDWSWFAGAFIACSLLHFWYDSFVWSVRKKQV
ncbi:hypothetical protein [Sphingosinicella sp.]|uniref:hypothetical protein n=1 Tax=Sphingosinicella sp. TaxID=1917971 RepID=UPI004037C736